MPGESAETLDDLRQDWGTRVRGAFYVLLFQA